MICFTISDPNKFLEKSKKILYEKMIEEACQACFKILKIKQELFFDINFVGNKKIKKINKKYRKINRVTDVISFAFNDSNEIKTPLLGEIFINYQRAKKQAKQYHHHLIREIIFLTIHGLLHLLQYDHATKRQEDKMISLTEQILKGIITNKKFLER